MRAALSFGLFVCLMIPLAAALLIIARDEIESKDKATGGYGLVTLFGFLVVFFVMPVFAFFVRF